MFNHLLKDLYTQKVNLESDSLDWHEWANENAYNVDEVDRAFYELQEQGLVGAASLGPFVEITTQGVFYVEKHRLADPSLIEREDRVRKTILRDLLTVRRDKGPNGYTDWETIWLNNSLDREHVGINLMVLADCSYLDFAGSAMVRLTASGLEIAKAMESIDALRERWSLLHAADVDPHARGHELERLLKQVAESEEWTAELNVRSAGEENDLIISKGFTYFLFSCKWESKKTGSTIVRDLRDRITARPGTMGVLVSVAGFTSEAVDWAQGRLESAVVLLVGPGDLKSVFEEGDSLTALLAAKHGALMTRRVIVVD